VNIRVGRLIPDRIDRDARMHVSVSVTPDRELTNSPSFQFTAVNGRPDDDWVTGTWEQLPGGRLIARSPLVGQRVVLAPEHYDVWMRVREGGETAILRLGRIRIV
jgi:hypothetical protein